MELSGRKYFITNLALITSYGLENFKQIVTQDCTVHMETG